MTAQRAGLWIPERIWQISTLSVMERIYLAEVAAFIDTGRECFASDEHFAQRLQISEQQARKILLKLVRLGFLDRDGYGRERKLRLSAQIHAGDCAYTSRMLRAEAQKVAPGGAHSKQDSKQDRIQKQGVEMPFEGKRFEEAWAAWKEYKKQEFRFSFKSAATEQAALHHLQKLSNNDESQSIEIIGHAIANQWRGLYAIRQQSAGAKQRGPILTPEGFHKHFGARQ